MAESDSKELGLGVVFSATIAGFAEQLTQVQEKLKEFARQLENFGKTSEKAMAGLAKATEKSQQAAEKAAESSQKQSVLAGKQSSVLKEQAKTQESLAKSTESTTFASKNYYQALEQVRADTVKLNAAQQSQIASSKMTDPVYKELVKRLNGATDASVGYKKALITMASEQGQTSIGFKNLANAALANEKAIIESTTKYSEFGKVIGPNGVQMGVKQWLSSINRVDMAHAKLGGTLTNTNGVITESGKTAAQTARTFASLEKSFGTASVENLKSKVGSTITTIGQFRAELVAEQSALKATNVHMIAAEKAISATQIAMNAANGSGDAWRKGVNEGAVAARFLKGELAQANGVVLKSGQAFADTAKSISKVGTEFRDSLSPARISAVSQGIGRTIGSLDEYRSALTKASDRSGEFSKRQADAGKAVRTFGENANMSGSMVSYLSNKIAEGNISYSRANELVKTYSRNIETQKAGYAGLIDASIRYNNKFKDVLASQSEFGNVARKAISTMNEEKVSIATVGDTLSQTNAKWQVSEREVSKWNKTVRENVNASSQVVTEMGRLSTAVSNGTMTAGQATESFNKFTKSIQGHKSAMGGATDSFKAFAHGIMGGGAASNVAAGYITNLATAVRSLAAWIPAAMIIGGLSQAIMGAIGGVKEFDQALKNLQAISQGTDTEIEMLGEQMITLSNNTKYSTVEIGKGAIFIAQAGFTAVETLQVLGAAAKLAQGTMSEMSTSADLLTTVLRVFQKDASESARIADQLAVAANKSKTDINGLRVAFNYLGPIAKATNLTLEETLASIMALANAGIRMSTIGTSMRQVLSRLENPTAALRNAITKAGLSIEDFNFKTHTLGQVALNMAKIIKDDAGNALKYFGERAGGSALVISNMGLHMDTLTGFMSELGAAESMATKQTEGLGVMVSMLGNRFENMLIGFTKGGFLDIIKGLVSGLTTLVDWLTVLANNSLVKFLAAVVLVRGSIGLLTKVFQVLMAVGLSSWLGVQKAAVLAMIDKMGIWGAITGTVSQKMVMLAASTSPFVVAVKALIVAFTELGAAIMTKVIIPLTAVTLVKLAEWVGYTRMELATFIQYSGVLATAYDLLVQKVKTFISALMVSVTNITWVAKSIEFLRAAMLLLEASTSGVITALKVFALKVIESSAVLTFFRDAITGIGLIFNAFSDYIGKGIAALRAYAATSVVATTAVNVFSKALLTLRAAFLATVTSVWGWVAIITGMIIWITSSSSAHQRETAILQKKSAAYLDNATQLRQYAKELTSLTENQKSNTDVFSQNLVVIDKIRKTYPELSSQLVGMNKPLKEQIASVKKLAEGQQKLAEETAKVTFKRLIAESLDAKRSADVYRDALDNDTGALKSLVKAFNIFSEGFWKTESTFAHLKVAFYDLFGGMFGLFDDKMTKAGDNFSNFNHALLKGVEEAASVIKPLSKEMRESLINSIPNDKIKAQVQAIIAQYDLEVAALKARAAATDEETANFRKNIESLGQEWIDYYTKQDSLGKAEVNKWADNAQKKIASIEKVYQKSSKTEEDGLKRDQDIEQTKQELYDKMVESREKQLDKLLGLIEKHYAKQEKLSKLYYDKEIESIRRYEKDELAHLDKREMTEADFIRRTTEIQESASKRRLQAIETETEAQLKSAQKMYDAQMEILEKQTVTDKTSRQIAAEEALAGRQVTIWTNTLATYKQLMSEKETSIEKYKQAAIAAEEAIAALQEKLTGKLLGLEDSRRSARQLTMTADQKAADNLNYYNELVSKGYKSLGEADKEVSQKVKDKKLKDAEDYFDKAKGLNESLVKMTTDMDGKIIQDDNATKDLRIANANELDNAYKKTIEMAIKGENDKKDAAVKSAATLQEALDALVKMYDEVTVKLQTAIVLEMNNTKAKEAIDELAKKIIEDTKLGKFRIIIDFQGTGSETLPLTEKIAAIQTAITNFQTWIKDTVKEAQFVINFVGSVIIGVTTPISESVDSVKLLLNSLSTSLTGSVTNFLIQMVGKDGSEQGFINVIEGKVRSLLDKLKTHIETLVSTFLVQFRGEDGGIGPLSSIINALISKMNALFQASNRTAVFTVITRNVTEGNAGGLIRKFDDGGKVPGVGNTDTVDAKLTPGEFVIQKSVVSKLGEGFFTALNGMKNFAMPKFTMQAVPAFAGGGPVKSVDHGTFTLNLTAGNSKLPLTVIGNPNTMRTQIKKFEKELSRMKLSRA